VGEVGERDGLAAAAGGEQRASLTRLARSAPEKPVVIAATWASSVSAASWTFFAWTSRIWSGPPCRAGRPGPGGRSGRRAAGRGRGLRAVGGAEQDHAGRGVEAVELGEELVERVLALVVAADAAEGAAGPAERVELVDEDDGGGGLPGLLEQVAHAGGADAHEHLDELGAGDREERHAGLAGHGLGDQGLAGAGGADEEDALRDAGA
jgi:hypothetical protein